jgi:hypothetical protein
MRRIYISSDYDEGNGDRAVVDEFYSWNESKRHSLEFVDLAKVVSGSVSQDSDCRICDLKEEFNRQINASSAVIFVVGDQTKYRTAGSACYRNAFNNRWGCLCTPYKQNANGAKYCKIDTTYEVTPSGDVGCINGYSYLHHEFEQAKKKGKKIVVVYNSLNKQSNWLPSYMAGYENEAIPFWIRDAAGKKIGDYNSIKNLLEE